jgi:hypothetical protein
MTGGKLPDRIAYSDAWKLGNEHGTIAMGKLEEFSSNVQNVMKDPGKSIGNLMGGLNKKFSANTGKTGLLDKIGDVLNGSGTGLPDPNDPKYGLGKSYDPKGVQDDIDDALKKLNGIDDNTGSMADSMELADEDLEYLRKLAEREWKKEFTTAEIKVDMSNYNTISGDGDLDGIVTRLRDRLYEELDAVADGVYA